MEPETRYARTDDGVSIAYAVFGDGPLIIYASTVWGTLHMVQSGVLGRRQQIERLVEMGWRVALYDCRGTGASEREVDDFSLESRLLDLEAVARQFAGESFVLVAEFMGTPVAIEYAARHPDRVSHLVLSNPFASGADYYRSLPAMGLIDALRQMTEREWGFFTQSLANAVVMFSDAGEARRVAAMMQQGMAPAQFGAFRDAAERIDITTRLPLVRTPTLVVRDESLSFSTSPGLVRTVAAGIPGASFLTSANISKAVTDFAGHATHAQGQPGWAAGGIRVVLFTDLVGHTRMMRRLGDERGRDVLRHHERITRETLRAHGGQEVKTLGDGFMAAFASATKATDCAIALQRAVEADGESTAERLHVRIGLNAGEPIEEDGDLFGSTVIMAARIAAMAGPGEILIPEPLRHLLSGKPYIYADRGDVLAKGFEDAVHLYEVRWQD